MNCLKTTSSVSQEQERLSDFSLSLSSWQRHLLVLRANMFQLSETIKGFNGIVNGDYDDLPEQAFYMVGSIEEAVEKAKTT